MFSSKDDHLNFIIYVVSLAWLMSQWQFIDSLCSLFVDQAVQKLGLWGLFTRGLPLRIVMIGTLTGAQWGIYDAFKVMVGL